MAAYGAPEREECGEWMPKAEVHCARLKGHKHTHRTRKSLDDKSQQDRDERAVPGGFHLPRELNRAKRAERKEFLDGIKLASGCTDCGYSKHPAALEFDHLPGTEKVAPVASMVLADMKRLLAEIEKCEIVCANCHRIRTTDRKQWKSEGPNKNRVKR
jgi:hypothetical protein